MKAGIVRSKQLQRYKCVYLSYVLIRVTRLDNSVSVSVSSSTVRYVTSEPSQPAGTAPHKALTTGADRWAWRHGNSTAETAADTSHHVNVIQGQARHVTSRNQ